MSQFLPCVWGWGACLTHLERCIVFCCFQASSPFTAVEDTCLRNTGVPSQLRKPLEAVQYRYKHTSCYKSLASVHAVTGVALAVQGSCCQMPRWFFAFVHNVQNHLPVRTEGGLFVPLVSACAVKNSKGLWLSSCSWEEMFWFRLHGKVIPTTCVHSEMGASGRMWKGSRTSKCV